MDTLHFVTFTKETKIMTKIPSSLLSLTTLLLHVFILPVFFLSFILIYESQWMTEFLNAGLGTIFNVLMLSSILIGIMDMVPYLHTFAIIPTAFLAMLKAADTGQNFWVLFGLALLGFIIVQVITDMFTTPRIMGSAMGLNPAVLLLSLSVWGALLGFIGLIIALPLTTIIIAYYQRYVTKDEGPPGIRQDQNPESAKKS